jgi:hypothetical protein
MAIENFRQKIVLKARFKRFPCGEIPGQPKNHESAAVFTLLNLLLFA